jgi:predicted methyltransferase
MAGAVDRAELVKNIYAALKPGVVVVVADHAANPGQGVSVVKTLHRIEEATVKSDFTRAGFEYVGHADFLRNPEDPRDKPPFKPTIKIDEFVLKFVKPKA